MIEPIRSLGASDTVVFIEPNTQAPFDAIRLLFDHQHAHPDDAANLNNIYPKRGIFKTVTLHNKSSDQKVHH